MMGDINAKGRDEKIEGIVGKGGSTVRYGMKL